jgi:hypothetical protein
MRAKPGGERPTGLELRSVFMSEKAILDNVLTMSFGDCREPDNRAAAARDTSTTRRRAKPRRRGLEMMAQRIPIDAAGVAPDEIRVALRGPDPQVGVFAARRTRPA